MLPCRPTPACSCASGVSRMPQSCRWLALGSLFVLAPAVMGQSGAVTELTVEPARITLSHADDRQQLLVTGKLGDGSLRDPTAKAQFASTRPSTAVGS